MAKSSCEGCVPPERQEGCHSWCDTYLEYKKQLEDAKSKHKKYDDDYIAYRVNLRDRQNKKK